MTFAMVSASTSFDLAELQTYFPAALLIILPLLILYICDARVFDKNGKRIQGPYSHLFGPSFFGIMRRGRNEKCPSRTILNELLNKLGDGKIVGCNVFGKIFLITCDPDYVKVVLNALEAKISNEMLSSVLVDWRTNYDYEIDGVIV